MQVFSSIQVQCPFYWFRKQFLKRNAGDAEPYRFYAFLLNPLRGFSAAALIALPDRSGCQPHMGYAFTDAIFWAMIRHQTQFDFGN